MATLAIANEIDIEPKRAAIPLVAQAFGVYLACGFLAWVARGLTFDNREVSTAVFQGCMVAISLLLLKRRGITWEQAGLRLPLAWRRWFLAITAVVTLNLATYFLLLISRSLYDPSEMQTSLMRRLFWLAVYVPIAEEILLRGWFQSSLSALFSGAREKFVVLLSAVIFGAMHLGWYLRGRPGKNTIIIVIECCFLGWLCARARQKSSSVIPAVVLHSVFNLTGVLIALVIDWILAHPKL